MLYVNYTSIKKKDFSDDNKCDFLNTVKTLILPVCFTFLLWLIEHLKLHICI